VMTGFIHPFFRLPLCKSARQLTQSDDENLLPGLANEEMVHELVPVLSISGGFAFLDIGGAGVFSRVKNRILQKLINEDVNDGLVGESSSDYSRAVGGGPLVTHVNNYEDWAETNHTYLIHRHELANAIGRWLGSGPGPTSGRKIAPEVDMSVPHQLSG
jgi:hypothetical protein